MNLAEIKNKDAENLFQRDLSQQLKHLHKYCMLDVSDINFVLKSSTFYIYKC